MHDPLEDLSSDDDAADEERKQKLLALYTNEMQTSTDNRKPYLIYSDNTYKVYWELVIAVLLILVCIIVPFRIALNLDDKVNEYGVVDTSR